MVPKVNRIWIHCIFDSKILIFFSELITSKVLNPTNLYKISFPEVIVNTYSDFNL